MANTKYGLYLQTQLSPSSAVDWIADDIKCVLIDGASYTPNFSTDQFLSDIPAPARIATSGNLTGKTIALGVADADDITIAVAAAQPSIEAVVIYKDTGVPATSKLILYDDTAALGLPFTPAPGGANVTIVWDSGANKIFTL